MIAIRDLVRVCVPLRFRALPVRIRECALRSRAGVVSDRRASRHGVRWWPGQIYWGKDPYALGLLGGDGSVVLPEVARRGSRPIGEAAEGGSRPARAGDVVVRAADGLVAEDDDGGQVDERHEMSGYRPGSTRPRT